MTIRLAELDDMLAVAELSRELAAHVQDPDPSVDASMLVERGFGPDPWFECLVAEQEGQIVGFALYCRRFEAHTRERRLLLGDLVVTASAREGGLGREL